MNIDGRHFRTIWPKPLDDRTVCVIDQRPLPFEFVIEELQTVEAMATAIRDMHVRGAGLIGGAAAYGMLLRGSEMVEEFSWEQILIQAKAAKGQDVEGYRAEFIRLVENTELLVQ